MQDQNGHRQRAADVMRFLGMNTLINVAIQIAITLAVIAAALAVIEALKRRGFDPVGRVAAFLSPPSEQPVSTNGDF